MSNRYTHPNTHIYLCPTCTDYFTPGKPGDVCATCGVECEVLLRVHTVASFDADGNGVDHRYEDMRVFDVTIDRAIELAETCYPKHRLLTGIEVLQDGPSLLRALCEAFEVTRDRFDTECYWLRHAVACAAPQAMMDGLPQSTVDDYVFGVLAKL